MAAQEESAPAPTPVLVLGASGRLGSMLRAFWPVDLPVELPVDLPVEFVGGPARGGIDLLTAPDLAERMAGRVVLSLAGSVADASGDYADHIRIAARLGEAAREARAPLLLASSAAVYGRSQDRPGGPGPLREDAPLPETLSPYGRAKAQAERAARESGAEVTALRIANVAGADAILGGWHPAMALDVFEDGRTPRRSYIGPADLAACLAGLSRIAGGATPLPPALNIAAPGTVEMGALLDAAGLGYATRPAPETAIPEVHLDTRRLGEVLGDLGELPAPASPASLVAQMRAWTSRVRAPTTAQTS